MVRIASLSSSTESQLLIADAAAEDRIDFDAWLLAPEVPNITEQAIRFCSTAAGPITFLIALMSFIRWLA
jgi:hypothetical protein